MEPGHLKEPDHGEITRSISYPIPVRQHLRQDRLEIRSFYRRLQGKDQWVHDPLVHRNGDVLDPELALGLEHGYDASSNDLMTLFRVQ